MCDYEQKPSITTAVPCVVLSLAASKYTVALRARRDSDRAKSRARTIGLVL